MVVREGYKLTEVGVALEEVTTKIGSGITPTGGSTVYQNHGVPFVRSQNVGWETLKVDGIAYISPELHRSFIGTEIQKGDILLDITGASIGRAAIVTNRIVGGNVNQHVCIIRSNAAILDAKYVSHTIISPICQHQINDFQAGGNRQGLNFAQAGSIQIPLPPIKAEQRAIATVLGDANSWIRSLEALIEKKRRVKEGVMAELLRPRAGWREVRLGEVLQGPPQYGINAAAVKCDGTLPAYLRITDINKYGNYDQFGKVSVRHSQSHKFVLKPGDIVLARTGASVGKLYKYVRSDGRLVYAGFLICIAPDEQVADTDFIFYYL